MALKVKVPIISITSEAEGDDDHNYIDIDALTDVEDIYVESDKVAKKNKKRKSKPKLVINLKDDYRICTDIEDIDTSDIEINFRMINHKHPLPQSIFDNVQDIVEERSDLKNKKTKATLDKTTLKSKVSKFNKKINRQITIEKEGLTDTEEMNASNDECLISDKYKESVIPDEFLRSFESTKVRDNGFQCTQPEINITTNENTFLNIQPNPDLSVTDVELLNDEDEGKRAKKMRRRKPKGSLRNLGSVTDIEDIDLSRDDARRYKTIKEIKPHPFLQVKLDRPNFACDSNTEDEDVKRGTNDTSRDEVINYGGFTDVEDMHLTDVDGNTSDVSESIADLDEYCALVDELIIAGEGSESCDRQESNEANFKNAMPSYASNIPSDITDITFSTDEEVFSDDNSIYPSVTLPKAERKLVIIHEATAGKPIVQILPLDKTVQLGLQNSEQGYLTDNEYLSDCEMDVFRTKSPFLPLGGKEFVWYKDQNSLFANQEKNVSSGLTDTEDVFIEVKEQKSKAYLMVRPNFNGNKTDVEEVLSSDAELEKQTTLKVNAIATGHTDLENVDYSTDSDSSIERGNLCAVPRLPSDFIVRKDCDGVSYLSINPTKKTITCRSNATDVEDFLASAEEDFSSFTCHTPVEIHKEFADASTNITLHNTKKGNFDKDKLFLKWDCINDSLTDVEDIEVDEQKKNRSNWTMKKKEWEAKGKLGQPAVEPEGSLKEIDDKGEASVSWQQVPADRSGQEKDEKEEAEVTTQGSPRPTDQHQLSEEMKELLKDMEKESKK